MKKYKNYPKKQHKSNKGVKNENKWKNNEIFKMKTYTTRSFDNKQYTNLEHLKQNSKSNKLDNESGVKKKSII